MPLKRRTQAFTDVTTRTVWEALEEDALTFVVLRTILGMSPPEWAGLTQSELHSQIPQGVARTLDTRCRKDKPYFSRMRIRSASGETATLVAALVEIAVKSINLGAPAAASEVVHRINQVDTTEGLVSLQHVATQHVPFAVLLYERFLGRPFASHRDSVSESMGDVMESAVDELLSRRKVTFRRTKRAERVPGWDQAPDFFIPDEFHTVAVIEAKITSDDGTARDKTTRIIHLAELAEERARSGREPFEVIACADGRDLAFGSDLVRHVLLHNESYTLVSTLGTLALS